MAYEVPDLPYGYDALEPHIDEATMKVHHDKHHQAYVDKANAALEGTEWADKAVEEVLKNLDSLPADKQTAVRNNGGGHANHSFFWQIMSPDGGGEPSGALADAIAEKFGSFDAFKEEFKNAGVGQFGSGWAWLVHDGSGLAVTSTAEPGLARLRRPDAAPRRRRLGARLLPQVPEQAPRLPRRLLERRQLGRGGKALRRGRVAPVARVPGSRVVEVADQGRRRRSGRFGREPTRTPSSGLDGRDQNLTWTGSRSAPSSISKNSRAVKPPELAMTEFGKIWIFVL